MPEKPKPNLWFARLCIVLGWVTSLLWLAFVLWAGALSLGTLAFALALFAGFRLLPWPVYYITHGPNE